MVDVKKLMSKRLMMIADCVEKCDKVFDAGSDHAFVPIYLVQRGICQKATASDIRKGPANVALKNIKKFNLTRRIDVQIGDGLENAEGYDCMIIAGMGGQLICDILQKGKGIPRVADQLILQPMNASEKVRKYLWDNGFNIYFEDLCSEKGKVYNVICAKHDDSAYEYKEYELHSSEYLVKNKHPLLDEFLAKKLRRLKAMYRGGGKTDVGLARIIRELEGLKL